MEKRFLRDNILDDMLHEIQTISEKLSDAEFPALMFSQSVGSISEMYETNKIVLQHLESAIMKMRAQKTPADIMDPVIEAAAHIQLGLMSIHSALKADIESLLNSITSLRSSLDILENGSK